MNKRDRVTGALVVLAGVVLIVWAYRGLKCPDGAALAPRDSAAYRAYLDCYHGITENALTGLLGLALVGAGVAFGWTGKAGSQATQAKFQDRSS